MRAVGQPITGNPVSQFAASPDGTQIAYAQQGCPTTDAAASGAGVLHTMDTTTGAVRTWRNTVSAATPARVSSQIEALSWTADSRTLVADYLWVPPEGSLDLAVLGLDAASSGGSLQAHSHVLFSQTARCTVCVYTAVVSKDGSSLIMAAATAAPGSATVPMYRLWVLQFFLFTGRPISFWYRSAASPGTYNGGGLVPVLSADETVQSWLLWNDPEQFGWLSGGQQIPLPKAPSGVLAVGW